VQTRDYIATLLAGLVVRRKLRDGVEAAVAVRLDRQRLVHEGDHRFAIVLEEAVLHFPIGSPDAMAAQLGHLLTVMSLPSIWPSTNSPNRPSTGIRPGTHRGSHRRDGHGPPSGLNAAVAILHAVTRLANHMETAASDLSADNRDGVPAVGANALRPSSSAVSLSCSWTRTRTAWAMSPIFQG
jgi:hypothetical protein